MEKKWLLRINLFLAAIVLTLIGWAGVIEWFRPDEIRPETIIKRPKILPPPAFEQPQAAYENIGEPFLHLRYANPTLELPNLKAQLVYYGKNERPDADAKAPLLHFAFTGDKVVSSAKLNEPLYIVFDRGLNPARYRFSINNAPTNLWIQAEMPQGTNIPINLYMNGEEGERITRPSANALFTLTEKDYTRFGGAAWEIDKWRVDATLLTRQKARWQGQDVFLDMLGGKEFADQKGKQRIDFGEGTETYSIFAGPTSCFVWKKDRWQDAHKEETTTEYPLLCVKSIDARLMNLELWDTNGNGKTTLTLLKTMEPALTAASLRGFKFIGARTLSQFLFEIDRKRVMIRPQDWLLQVDKDWIKLDSPKLIDDYVERRIVGQLFVFEGLTRVGDRQVVQGILFNASRTQSVSIELPIIANKNSSVTESSANSNEKSPLTRQLSGPNLIKERAEEREEANERSPAALKAASNARSPSSPASTRQRLKPAE